MVLQHLLLLCARDHTAMHWGRLRAFRSVACALQKLRTRIRLGCNFCIGDDSTALNVHARTQLKLTSNSG